MTDADLEITPLSSDPKYVVEINEVMVFTYSGSNPERWLHFRSAPGIVPRLTVAKQGWPGDLVHIAFEKREEAADFREFLIRHCVHKSAIKVKRAPKRVVTP